MDFVLEIFDAFVLDKLYAQVLPRHGSVATFVNTNLAKGSEFYSNLTVSSPAASVLDHPLIATVTGALSSSNREIYGRHATYYFEPSEWATQSLLGRDSIIRQAVSIFLITWIFGYALYLLVAGLSYRFVYDPMNFKHPKYLKNQVRLELEQSLSAIPVMTALTVPWFVAELRGFSKLYWSTSKYGTWYMIFQFPLFLLFTDMLIYFIHRWLHTPGVYKHLHKPHHKWIVPTPFASHAFHPVDGYMQSLPYHIFPFIFPLQKVSYVVLFMIVNVWTVMIHDGEYLSNDPVINGSACHTIHHLYFNYNYGQYTTLWDRLGGSYRTPDKELFDRSLKQAKSTWKKQTTAMEDIRSSVEDEVDDREYAADIDAKKNQ